MSKTKINLKLLIALFGVALVMCLAPLGIQAIATDNVDDSVDEISSTDQVVDGIDESIVESESNATTINVQCEEWYATLVTLNNQKSFELIDGESVIYEGETTNIDHVGYLYIKHLDNSITCIAAVFANSCPAGVCYKFNSWSANNNTYTAKFETYDVSTDGYGYYAGVTGEGGGFGPVTPIANVEVSWVNSKDGSYITRYSNNFGFVCVPVPLDVPGSFHIIKEGYVSDYTGNITMDAVEHPIDYTNVRLTKGILTTVQSNQQNLKFHVREWYGTSGTQQGQGEVTEDIYLSVIPTRMLPEGAKLAVLSDEECDQHNVVHGTLYYVYYDGGLGGTLYEISFEPSTELEVENWVYTNEAGESEIMEIDKDYEISADAGHAFFQLNYVVPPEPGIETAVTDSAQTGDNNLGIVIALCVVAVACGGFIAYRKIKKK